MAEAEQSQGGADEGIMWPSQNEESPVTASVQQSKAKATTDALRAEKEAALARKRQLFD